MRTKTRSGVLIIRVSDEEKKDILRVAERLDLSSSEIGRRAIRLGLSELGNADLPGAAVKSEKSRGAHGS